MKIQPIAKYCPPDFEVLIYLRASTGPVMIMLKNAIQNLADYEMTWTFATFLTTFNAEIMVKAELSLSLLKNLMFNFEVLAQRNVFLLSVI